MSRTDELIERLPGYMPAKVELYPTPRGSVLRPDKDDEMARRIEEAVCEGQHYPIYDYVMDSFEVVKDEIDAVNWYVDEMRERAVEDGFTGEEFDEVVDVAESMVYDADCSDFVGDMTRETRLVFSYTLIDKWTLYQYRGDAQGLLRRVARRLGVKSDSADYEKLRVMVSQSCWNRANELKVYWRCPLSDMFGWKKPKTIACRGKFYVALHDSVNGAGDYCKVSLSKAFKFEDSALKLSCSEVHGYSIEKVFEMPSYWCQDGDSPLLSQFGRRSNYIRNWLAIES